MQARRIKGTLFAIVLTIFTACRDEPPVQVADEMKAGLDAMYTRRDAPAAAEHFRKVLAENPAHYGATYQLAVALDAAGKRDDAKPYWEKALRMAEEYKDENAAAVARTRLAPQAPDKHAIWMASGVDLLHKLNRPADAATEFRKILAENPEHYGANYQLATALDRSGNRDEAQRLWEKVLVMAEGYKDAETLRTAKSRLGRN